MVRIIQNCDCRTCDGGTPAPAGVFGGSICTCPCHLSGHPIDSDEHKAWDKKRWEEHYKRLMEGLGYPDAKPPEFPDEIKVEDSQ